LNSVRRQVEGELEISVIGAAKNGSPMFYDNNNCKREKREDDE
jgi:hypothetical protein